jgi:pentatricopeptide repeat protein
MERMERAGLERNIVTFNILISGCARNGMALDAQRFFNQMAQAGVNPNQVTYNSLICAYARINELSEAFRVRDEMMEAGYQPDQVTFNTLITGCAKARRIEEAFHLMSSMRRAGLPPDQISFGALIDACSRTNQMQCAYEVLQDMVRVGIQPDLITCNTLIYGYTKEHDFTQSMAILSLLLAQSTLSPDRFTMRPIMELCQHNRGAGLQEVYDCIRNRPRRTPSTSASKKSLVCMLSAIIDTSMSLQSYDLALSALNDLEEEDAQYVSQEGFTAAQVRAAQQ